MQPLEAASPAPSQTRAEPFSGAILRLVNSGQQTVYKATSDRQDLYTFPNLSVGHYDLTVSATGFTTQRKTDLTIDADSALRVDLALAIGGTSDTVTVTSNNSAQVETSATHLGEVVSADQMTSLPLNGRSYTDLLAIQPGVTPVSTLLPNAVIMAGVTGGIDPSCDANPGNLSINGQRESANGFMVNGIDVQEHMNRGTSIIPNLNSIEEFRVLTTNFDPEYGNYNGGIVTVVSKSGTNNLHGSVFEFFRNTNLDAKDTSTRPAPPSIRISLVEPSEARSNAINSSFLITKEPAPPRASPLAISRPHCRPAQRQLQ